jgi:DHA3 family macrolide efflux protein-like MFS transporter
VDQAEGNAGAQRANFVTLLRNRNFRNLWLGQVVSQMGDYFAFLAIMVVVGSFSPDVGATTTQISGALIASALPRLLFGILAGVFVDRWDRRLTMLVADLVRPAITLAMIPAFLTRNLWLMYLLAFLLSTVGTCFNPAKGALIPNLVPPEQLLAANALSQTSMTMAFILGPALAGATFYVLGAGNEWLAFVFDAVSYLVSAGTIWMIRLPKEATQPAAETPADGRAVGRVWNELVVGVKALAFNRVMATLTLVFGIVMLGVGALNVLWVSLLKAVFGYTDAAAIGWRFALLDVVFFSGMALGTVVVGNFLARRPPKDFVVWGIIVFGLGMAPLGYLPDYWLLVAIMLVSGAALAPLQTGVMTLMQIVVPNDQLGRVGGGMSTVNDSTSLLSMALAGMLGATIGIPLVFLLGGLICILGGIIALVGLPAVTLKDMPQAQETTARGVEEGMARVV